MSVSKPLLQSQNGFTLVEVMTAVLILSIGLLGVGTLVVTSMRTGAYNSRVRQAEYLAAAKMEELRALPADCPNSECSDCSDCPPDNSPTGEGKYPLADGTESDTPGNNQVYVRHVTIGSYPDSMVLVRVVVGWPYDPTKSPTPCDKEHIEGCTYKFRSNATILKR